MNHRQHCHALEADALDLVALVSEADLSTPVPTCPGWTVADVVDHVGTLYRWSAADVSTGARWRLSQEDLDLDVDPEAGPAGQRGHPAWLAAGIEPMLATFRSSDPEASVWGWGADRHNRFWPRRMLFETVIHRVDVAMALHAEPEVIPEVAVDGIDELLVNLPHAAYFAPGIRELRGDGQQVALHATDTDTSWLIRLLPAGYSWDWSTGSPDVTVRGTAADLLLLVYRRAPAADPRYQRDGDVDVLDRFLAGVAL